MIWVIENGRKGKKDSVKYLMFAKNYFCSENQRMESLQDLEYTFPRSKQYHDIST